MSELAKKSRSTHAVRRKPVISVVGAGKCSKKLQELAELVGRTIAEHDAVLLCGGLGGVMEAAARGAKSAGGATIGIIPTDRKSDANEYLDYVIVTGMGEGRNMLVAKSADAMIALPGKYGTLTEMAFALLNQIPVISISAWKLGDEVLQIEDPAEAVKQAVEMARKRICA